MKKLLTFLLILFVAPALADDFDDWDADGDGKLEKHEFKKMFVENYFDPMKGESTIGIISEDYFQSMYTGLDTDQDHELSDEEWMVGYNYFFENYIVYEDVDMIDMNEDGSVEYEEFYDAIYDTAYFTDIDMDSDNYISEHELAEYVFKNWDSNNSGIMSKSEFDRFKTYYLDV